MQRLGTWIGAAAILCGAATAEAQGQAAKPPAGAARPAATASAPATAQPDPARDAQMLTLLRRWEQVSQTNETLYASFTRTDRSPELVGKPKVFEGQALLRKPNLACLEFNEVVSDRPKPIFNQRIVCTGQAVYQFLGATKQVFIFPMADDEQRRATEEGPLPFIFNMRVDAARRRYEWTLVGERPATPSRAAADGKPAVPARPACWRIRITPRQAVDREEFSVAEVWIGKETFLPEALMLTSPEGKATKTFVFKAVERNGKNLANNPANYDGEAMVSLFQKSGYKVDRNPQSPGQEPAARAAAVPAPEPVAGPATGQPPASGRGGLFRRR